MHEYVSDPQSGAGNCKCGWAEHTVQHPHNFTEAMNWPDICVCSKPRDHQSHRALVRSNR